MTNKLLTVIAVCLFSYIIVISANILNPPQTYKPQVLSSTSTAPISVEIKNTKLMTNSQTLYETDINIVTTASVSAGFWYQGPTNPYGTSIFEENTIPLKKDRTFHISALPAGTYEYFAVSFGNQNQKPPYVRFPETGTNQFFVGVTPSPSPTTSLTPTRPLIPDANYPL